MTRFVLGVKPNFRDLEVYDPELFKSLQRLLAVPSAENWASLDFSGMQRSSRTDRDEVSLGRDGGERERPREIEHSQT